MKKLMIVLLLGMVVMFSCAGFMPPVDDNGSLKDGVYIYQRPFGKTLVIAVKNNSLQIYDAATGGRVFSENQTDSSYDFRGSSSSSYGMYGDYGSHGGYGGRYYPKSYFKNGRYYVQQGALGEYQLSSPPR